jgi:predicted type IV restriction endonuclease
VSPDLEEFRQRVIAHAKLVTSRAPKVASEAQTNASLVQPFLMTLGYDVANPDEVCAEHHALTTPLIFLLPRSCADSP